MPDTVHTVLWTSDDGWRYHPKHVEQLTDINILYIVVTCWIITNPSIHWTGLGWPQDRSGRVGEDRNLLPLQGLLNNNNTTNNSNILIFSLKGPSSVRLLQILRNS